MIKSEPTAPRFIFQQSALTLGGSFRKPYHDAFAAPSVMLPVTGGVNSARLEGFRHRDRVACRSAYCEVSGFEKEGGVFQSCASVTLEGLSVMDVVTADVIVARLVSTYRDGETKVDAGGSRIVGLRIAGEPAKVSLKPVVRETPTHAAVASRLAQNADACRTSADRADPVFSTSLFDVEAGRVSRVQGSTFVDVPDFGRIYIGEMLVSRLARRLTMLRIQLGCPVEGDLTAGDLGIDGHPYP